MRVIQTTEGASALRAMYAAVVVAVMWAVLGCAAPLANHAFSFEASEWPGIEILDYRYGDSRQPGARANPTQSGSSARVRQGVNIIAEMRRPDSLYVQWRDIAAGKIYEDTVNLARLLPRNIEEHRIHFTVRGPQLFVYLITPEKRGPNDPAIGPREYQYRKTLVLAADVGHEIAAK